MGRRDGDGDQRRVQGEGQVDGEVGGEGAESQKHLDRLGD